MVILQKAQVILAQSFFCTSAIECNISKASKMLKSFQPFSLSANASTTIKHYSDSNYFIPQFGKIRMYGPMINSPFTMRLTSMASEEKRKELLSVCYGAKANFYIHATMIAYPGINCLILPMIHFFPSRMVTVLYSCYVESENKDVVDFIADLKKAFNTGRTDLLLKSSTKMPGDFHSFKSLTNDILQHITHAMKEYEFQNSNSHKYSFIHFLDGKMKDGEFDRTMFCGLACKLTRSTFLNAEYIEEKRLVNWCGRTYFEYSYIAEHEVIHITDGSFNNVSKTFEKHLRSNGWKMFARLEFAQFDKLLLYYLTAKADELKRYVQADIRGESSSILKPKIYDRSYEKLCGSYLNNLEYTADSYSRKMVYACYGSKEKRQHLLDELQNKIQQLQGLYGERKSIYQHLFGILSALANILPSNSEK